MGGPVISSLLPPPRDWGDCQPLGQTEPWLNGAFRECEACPGGYGEDMSLEMPVATAAGFGKSRFFTGKTAYSARCACQAFGRGLPKTDIYGHIIW